MKIANVKTMVAKVMVLGVAAGAFLFASPVKAQAERFGIGVEVGNPYGYYYGRPGFEFERRREFERREAFLRHEEWLRSHRFYGGYGYR